MKKTIWTFLSAMLLFALGTNAQAQQFGGAVAQTVGDIIVGMSGQNATNSSVYVYRKSDDGMWAQAAQLVRSDNNGEDDRFGRALAAEGNTLLVGATTADNSKGGVWVFERDAEGNWMETGKLTPDTVQEGDSFGRSIALSGDWAAVGAAGTDEQKGAVYVFHRMNGAWMLHSTLQSPYDGQGGFFGLQVAMSGTNLLVGAPFTGQSEDAPPQGDVYAYHFDAASNEWKGGATLPKFPGLLDDANFGLSIAMQGPMAVVAAPGLGGMLGGAIVYMNGGNAWNFAGILLPYAPQSPNSGNPIALVGNEVWMASQAGVYQYLGVDQNVTSAQMLLGGDISGATAFSVDGDVAVVGQGGNDAAHILQRGENGWELVQTVETEYQDLYPSITGGKVDCESGDINGFDCSEVDLLSFVSLGDLGGTKGIRMNDVWGWTDPASGREFALAGRTNGTSFVEVTDPENPRYLGDLPMTPGANAAAWRDMKVFNNHVFIVADGSGQHGMQVFDLAHLLTVTEPQTFAPDAFYGEIGSAHNIVINEDTGFAYAVGVNSGGETCGGGLHMIDVNDPLNPTFRGCFGHEGTGRAGTGYSHDAQCVIYAGPDTEHAGKEICFGGNETAVSIADVTDKDNPIALSTAEYPNAGYTHQGWLTDNHEFFYVNDELDEISGEQSRTRTLIFDVRDLDDPILVQEMMGTTAASDHNLYVQGNYMYQSNYSAGLRILDISDPANPVEVGYFDVNPVGDNEAGFNGTWSNYPYFKSGTILVTGIESGLFMLKKK
ncbi:MAG: choice-of-anchor B family protein, partial [Bacteroidetes bacterium]|nr:choice-of-anchor B family protein [Bacteroidota bacterium]